jgi:hypothetical protein
MKRAPASLASFAMASFVVEPEGDRILGELLDIDGLLDIRRWLLEPELDGPLRQPAPQRPIDIVREVAVEEIGHLPPPLGEGPARRPRYMPPMRSSPPSMTMTISGFWPWASSYCRRSRSIVELAPKVPAFRTT